MKLNDLPGIDGLAKGDRLTVTLKKSNRVRKGARGKTFEIVFDGVRPVDVTESTAKVSRDGGTTNVEHQFDGGWVLEGRGEDGVLQGFHDWSIRSVERVRPILP